MDIHAAQRGQFPAPGCHMRGYRPRAGRFLAECPPPSKLMTGVEGSTVGAVNQLVECDKSFYRWADGPHFVWVKNGQNMSKGF